MCPYLFPPGFHLYGNRKHGPGHPSRKIQRNRTQIDAALAQPPMSDNNNEIVSGSQPRNQPTFYKQS